MYSYRSYSIRELFAGKARRVCAKGECDDDEKKIFFGRIISGWEE